MVIQIRRATIDDIPDLLDVQNQAFFADYLKYGQCPGYHRSADSMRQSVEKAITFLIDVDGKPAGDIIVRDMGNRNYYLGCLCVIPAHENKGIGQTAMAYLDAFFPDAVHWSLETPADKERNHYFYQKHGYQITKEYWDGPVKIVLFERDVSKIKTTQC